LESADRYRPKEFFRRRETSHQIGEVPQPGAVLWADALSEFGNKSRLCCARRPENDQMLPRKQCDQRSANDLIAFDQRCRQFAFNGLQFIERWFDGCEIGCRGHSNHPFVDCPQLCSYPEFQQNWGLKGPFAASTTH